MPHQRSDAPDLLVAFLQRRGKRDSLAIRGAELYQLAGQRPARAHALDDFLSEIAAFLVADGPLDLAGFGGDGLVVHVAAKPGDAGLDTLRVECVEANRADP
jgi:hypothetical protein